jgi:hypothetical protein
MMPRRKGSSCTAGERHWFAYYGCVGSSSPVCRKCGAENEHYDQDRDPLPDHLELEWLE